MGEMDSQAHKGEGWLRLAGLLARPGPGRGGWTVGRPGARELWGGWGQILVPPHPRSLVAEQPGPFLTPPPGGGRQQLTGWGPQFMGWREPGLWRVGSSGASDESLPRTAGQLQDAMSCWGEMQGGTRRVRVPHRPGTFQEAQKRSREEELKRQQNRNRNSEEGLPSGGEGKQRLGDGSRPAGGRRALGPSLSLPHAARCSGTGREVSGGGAS